MENQNWGNNSQQMQHNWSSRGDSHNNANYTSNMNYQFASGPMPPVPPQKTHSSKALKVVIIAICCVVLLLGVAMLGLHAYFGSAGGDSPESVAKGYFSAIKDKDEEALQQLLPKGSGTVKDVVGDLDEMAATRAASGIEIVKITVEDTKSYSKSDLKSLKDKSAKGVAKLFVKDAWDVDVSITLSVNDGTNLSYYVQQAKVVVIEMGGSYYFISSEEGELTQATDTINNTDPNPDYGNVVGDTEDTSVLASEETSEINTDTTEYVESSTELITENKNSTGSLDLLGFSVNGKSYTWPISYETALEFGFDLEPYKDTVINASSLGEIEIAYAQGSTSNYVYFRFKNKSNEAKKLSECELATIDFIKEEYCNPNLNVTMSNGVTYGMTHDDVIAIMGDADYSYGVATDSYSTLSYYLNKNYDQEVEFIFTDGVLSEIQLNDSTL